MRDFQRAKNPEKMRDFYRILDPPMGTGAYGEVRKCVFKQNMKDKKSSIKQFRAVKILSKAYMEEKDFNFFANEVACLYKLDHPSILKMYHYFEDPKRYLLITDLCEGGELYSLIMQEKKFESREAAYIMKQVLSAVVYMHEQRIIHRDLKPENILLTEPYHEFPEVKLIDFGTARHVIDEDSLTERLGTIPYMAPEVIDPAVDSYTFKCDVWSLGVIAYVLLCGELPFKGETNEEIAQKIKDFEGEDDDIF